MRRNKRREARVSRWVVFNYIESAVIHRAYEPGYVVLCICRFSWLFPSRGAPSGIPLPHEGSHVRRVLTGIVPELLSSRCGADEESLRCPSSISASHGCPMLQFEVMRLKFECCTQGRKDRGMRVRRSARRFCPTHRPGEQHPHVGRIQDIGPFQVRGRIHDDGVIGY